MRLSGIAITNILQQRQASFLNEPNKKKTYAYLMYEHKVLNQLLSGDVAAAEYTLLYDSSFGMGCIEQNEQASKTAENTIPKNEAILKTMQISFGQRIQQHMWNKFPEVVPPDIPESEDFGINYEVKYRLPNGIVETTITEWLWEREWNCIYPVIAWREYDPVIQFDKKKWKRPEHV